MILSNCSCKHTLLTLYTALLLRLLKQILQQMWAADLVPNDIVYNSAIDAMAKGGKPDQARELLQHMLDSGVTPTEYSYNSAISACGKAQDAEGAQQLLAEMKVH
jgi:pentatricopeptide repeat domain-containing protein 1